MFASPYNDINNYNEARTIGKYHLETMRGGLLCNSIQWLSVNGTIPFHKSMMVSNEKFRANQIISPHERKMDRIDNHEKSIILHPPNTGGWRIYRANPSQSVMIIRLFNDLKRGKFKSFYPMLCYDALSHSTTKHYCWASKSPLSAPVG